MSESSADRATARAVLRRYWRVAEARPWHFAVPVTLILVASAFEAASYSMLVPLTDAVADNSFAFLSESRWFGWIAGLVPPSVADPAMRDAWLVVILVGLVVIGRVGKLGAEYVRKYFVVARNERYRVRIGADTFGRVLGFGRQYFDRNAIGRTDAEVGWSNSAIGLLVAAEEVFRYAVGLLVKACVMIAISVPLSIAFVITLPFVSWFMLAINRSVQRISARGVEVDRRIRERLLDILGSIPLVKAYSQEDPSAASYEAILREAETVAVRRDRVVSLRYPVEEVVILVVMLFVQTAVIFLTGEFRPGDLAAFGAFLLVLQQALPDYKYLSLFSLKVSEEVPRLEAVAGLFVDDGKFVVPSGPRWFGGLRDGISIRGLDFRYQEGADTLKAIDAEIPAGKVTAIVGKSGAGKTTFVDLIARFYDCAPGAILFDGIDVREYSLSSLHRTMAIVSQDVWLLNRSVRDNLTFGLDEAPAESRLLEALEDAALGDLVRELPRGLDTEVGDRGVRLSGGQRQRLALARALLREPDILILDEATSALDSVVEQRVARSIAERVQGHTLIMIAHRLSTIRDADLILVMADGRLVERGTWLELLARGGHFAELHRAQFDEDAGVGVPSGPEPSVSL